MIDFWFFLFCTKTPTRSTEPFGSPWPLLSEGLRILFHGLFLVEFFFGSCKVLFLFMPLLHSHLVSFANNSRFPYSFSFSVFLSVCFSVHGHVFCFVTLFYFSLVSVICLCSCFQVFSFLPSNFGSWPASILAGPMNQGEKLRLPGWIRRPSWNVDLLWQVVPQPSLLCRKYSHWPSHFMKR